MIMTAEQANLLAALAALAMRRAAEAAGVVLATWEPAEQPPQQHDEREAA